MDVSHVSNTPGAEDRRINGSSYSMVARGNASSSLGHGAGNFLEDDDVVSDDDRAFDGQTEENCPTILLTKEEKKRLRMEKCPDYQAIL